MKQSNTLLLIAGLLALLALPGCYTQLGLTRQEREADREYTASEPDTSAAVAEDQESYQPYDNNYDPYADQWRPHVGFSYYYPSTFWPSAAFAISYANPWAYDPYYAYDPWLCGTPYVHYPYYGYGYYAPAYVYASNPYHYGYAYGGRRVQRGGREFGQTRGTAGNRGTVGNRGTEGSGYQPTNTGGTDLPRGARVASPAGAPAPRSTPTVTTPGRTNGTSRGAYVPRSSGSSTGRSSQPAVRGSSPRGGNSRGEGRQTQPRYRTPSSPAMPPAGSRAPSQDNGGSRGSSTPSYTPPAQHTAPPPAPAAPAPASGGRGGDTRGRRP